MKFQSNNLRHVIIHEEARQAIFRLKEHLFARNYSSRTIGMYTNEMQFLFAYYPTLTPDELQEDLIVDYINFLIRNKGVGRSKCRCVAHACSYFYRHILKLPYAVPSVLYPKRHAVIPNIIPRDQIEKIINSITNLKYKLMISMFYGTGLRTRELQHIRIQDINVDRFQFLVREPKGGNQRMAILPKSILPLLKMYLMKAEPAIYLFEGKTKGQHLEIRTINWIVKTCVKQSKLNNPTISPRTFRHCFATHLFEEGNNLLAVKELMGHKRIESTMVYLHFTQQAREAVVSPLDHLQILPIGGTQISLFPHHF
jgi:site-specific recombinase XerD